MQALPIAIMAAGSLVQGVAGYSAGQHNARVADANSVDALNEGVAQAARVRDQARADMGEQAASLAGNGFEGNTGSAITRLQESAISAELDIQEARRQARSRAAAIQEQGRQAARQGKMALLGGLFGAASAVARVGDYAQLGAQYGYGGSGGGATAFAGAA